MGQPAGWRGNRHETGFLEACGILACQAATTAQAVAIVRASSLPPCSPAGIRGIEWDAVELPSQVGGGAGCSLARQLMRATPLVPFV